MPLSAGRNLRRGRLLPCHPPVWHTGAADRTACARAPGIAGPHGRYDFWIAIDDIARFNSAAEASDLHPTLAPEEAQGRGRYVVENDEHVDVLVARSVTTVDGVDVLFEDVWTRRRTIGLEPGVDVHIPSVADLILTKRFANRPKDLEDIRLLRGLDSGGET